MLIFQVLLLADETNDTTLLDMAKFAIGASYRAGNQGVFALEEFLNTEFNLSLSSKAQEIAERLFEFLIDGAETDYLSDMAYYSICGAEAATLSEHEKLALMMAAESLVSIRRGESPSFLCNKLAVMLGETVGSKLYALYPDISKACLEKEKIVARQIKKAHAKRLERTLPKKNKSKLGSVDNLEYTLNFFSPQNIENIHCLTDLKSVILQIIGDFIQESANLRKVLRETLLKFAKDNALDTIVPILGDYGTDKDIVLFFHVKFLKFSDNVKRYGDMKDLFLFSEKESFQKTDDLVCADKRLCSCIEELDYDEWKN